MAQDSFVDKEMKKIDSLIFYCHFFEGKKEIYSLSEWLAKTGKREKYIDAELQLLLYKAYIFSREPSPHRALEVALNVIDLAKEYNLPEKEYQAYLFAAVMYESSDDLNTCKEYLDKAHLVSQRHHLENVYAVYCIRLSSYYRFVGENDSAIRYAYRGLDYAKKYGNKREFIDACLLLGGLLSKDDYHKATNYSALAAHAFLNKNDYLGTAAMYNNIANVFLKHKELEKALLYSDSSLLVLKDYSIPIMYYVFEVRYRIFEALGNKDSAYHYFKKHHDAYIKELHEMETFEVKKITEKYQSQKREAALKNKNQQLVLIVSLLFIIVFAIILIIRKNRRISSQNKVISKQVEELIRTLEQKQVLLSELQHRVKNNLQHVISILEIQKESVEIQKGSVDFNNIDELIRSNQNRIHSMALLHKKLNVSDNVNDVDLKKYVTELSELVKESYDSHRKKVTLNVSCDIKRMSIEKALPIGLIIVELVSNSMKHAFKKQHIGIIQIALTQEIGTKDKKLHYTDNGSGFDFNTTPDKGLGMEIIKGLIGQLDATIESSSDNGFRLSLSFK